MGVDPGTQFTGFGIIEPAGRSLISIDYGVITPKKSLPLEKKYLTIFNGIDELVEKYKPDAIAVETQFVRKNIQVALKLGMARGVALVAASRHDIPIFEYAPRKAKQAVTGNGGASKDQVQTMVKVLLNLSNIPREDAADALALEICHHNSIQFLEKTTCTNT